MTELQRGKEKLKFNPSDYKKPNDEFFSVAYYNQKLGEWGFGKLAELPEVTADKKIKVTVEVIDSKGTRQNDLKVELPPGQTPKKFEDFTASEKTFKAGKTYFKAIKTKAVEGGVIEYDLAECDDKGDEIKDGEKLRNINGEMLNNFDALRDVEKNIGEKIGEVKKVAGEKHKQILGKLNNLSKQSKQIEKLLGDVEDWYDLGGKEIEDINKRIKDIKDKIDSDLEDLKLEIDELDKMTPKTERQVQTAEGFGHIIDRNKSKNQQDKEKYDKDLEAYNKRLDEQKAWDKKKREWDAWNAIPPSQKKGKAPENPGDRANDRPLDLPNPTEIKLKAEEEVAYEWYVTKSREVLLPTSSSTPEEKNFILEVKAYITDPSTIRKLGLTDAESKKAATGKKVLEMIREWKGASAELFDFAKETTELNSRLEALKDKVDEKKRKALEREVKQLDPKATDIKDKVLGLLKRVGDLEVEAEVAPAEEIKKEETKIEIPSHALFEILKDPAYKDKMKGVMEMAFAGKLDGKNVSTEIAAGLMSLFEKEPANLDVLRKYGVKNWDHFKRVLKEKGLMEKMSAVLMTWADEQIKAEIILNTTTREDIITGLKKMWAIKGPLAGRLLTTLACVGGTAAAVTLIAGSGGLVGVGLAAAGGAAGGLVRGVLNKAVFGKKEKKEEMARKVQAAEEQRINALIEKKQAGLAKELAGKMFGGDDAAKVAAEVRQFSAILSEVMRQSQEEKQTKVGDTVLEGNAQRMYLDALKQLKLEGGLELSEAQKIELALAISKLQVSGDQKVLEKVKAADPAMVKILDGLMKAVSGRSADQTGVLKTAGGIAASSLMGSTVGMAFLTSSGWARASMGAATGGLVGYRMGKKSEAKLLEKEAIEELKNIKLPEFLQKIEDYRKIADQAYKDAAKPELIKLVDGYKMALLGKGDLVLAKVLEKNPLLRTQVQDAVYEANSLGLYVERYVEDKSDSKVERKDFSNWSFVLSKIQENGKKFEEEADKEMAQRKKTGKVVLYTVFGAGIGVLGSFLIGEGVGMAKEKMGFGGEHIQKAEANKISEPVKPSTTEKIGASTATTAGQEQPRAAVAEEQPKTIAAPEATSPVEDIRSHSIESGIAKAGDSPNSLLHKLYINMQTHPESAPAKFKTDGKLMSEREFINWGHEQLQSKGGITGKGYGYDFHRPDGSIKHGLVIHEGAKFRVGAINGEQRLVVEDTTSNNTGVTVSRRGLLEVPGKGFKTTDFKSATIPESTHVGGKTGAQLLAERKNILTEVDEGELGKGEAPGHELDKQIWEGGDEIKIKPVGGYSELDKREMQAIQDQLSKMKGDEAQQENYLAAVSQYKDIVQTGRWEDLAGMRESLGLAPNQSSIGSEYAVVSGAEHHFVKGEAVDPRLANEIGQNILRADKNLDVTKEVKMPAQDAAGYAETDAPEYVTSSLKLIDVWDKNFDLWAQTGDDAHIVDGLRDRIDSLLYNDQNFRNETYGILDDATMTSQTKVEKLVEIIKETYGKDYLTTEEKLLTSKNPVEEYPELFTKVRMTDVNTNLPIEGAEAIAVKPGSGKVGHALISLESDGKRLFSSSIDSLYMASNDGFLTVIPESEI